MNKLNLYTAVGCHLCEKALALLIQAKAQGYDFEICEVEISDAESLMDAYGTRIPVIRFTDNEGELGWPFDYAALELFLAQHENT